METASLDEESRDLEHDRKLAAPSAPESVDGDSGVLLNPSIYDVDFNRHPRSGVLKHSRPAVRQTIPKLDVVAFQFIYPDQSGSMMKASAKTISQKSQKAHSKRKSRNSDERLSKKPSSLGRAAIRASMRSSGADEEVGEPPNKKARAFTHELFADYKPPPAGTRPKEASKGRSTRRIASKPSRLKDGYSSPDSESTSHSSLDDTAGVSSDGMGQRRTARKVSTPAHLRGFDRTDDRPKKKPKKKGPAPAPRKKAPTPTKRKGSIFSGKTGNPWTPEQTGPRIAEPHVHDVLMGRGNGIARHAGNIIFRDYCWQMREEYNNALRSNKTAIASKVLDEVLSQNPPGRFLEFVDGFWEEVDETKRLEKICQALREKKWYPVHQDLLNRAQQMAYSMSPQSINNSPSAPADKRPTSKVKKSPNSLPKEKKKVKSPPSSSKKSSPQGQAKPLAASTTPGSEKSVTPTESSPRAAAALPKGKAPSKSNKDVTVGSQIMVYWPLDDQHYPAEVKDKIHDLYYLRYDDGETEWLDLTKHQYIVTSYGGGASQAPAPAADAAFVPIAPHPEDKE